jgi:Na+-transporting NADH:ubiquinone oxidoreductase subunit C
VKKNIRILVFVIVMGTVSGAFLVGINSFTAPLIARNEELKLKSSILDVAEIPYTKEDALAVFDKNIKTFKVDKFAYYRSPDRAAIFEFHGPGLWGPISGTLSLNADLRTIKKIRILHQEETPGLGGRIAEENFLKQFRNKEIHPKIVFMPEGKARANNEVDAITGATGSSKAFEKLLNESLEADLKFIKD